MVFTDKRRSQIISTATHFFGIPIDPNETMLSTPFLDNFLDQSACRALYAIPVNATGDEDGGQTGCDGGLQLKLTNELFEGKRALVFFKLTASLVTDENFHDIVQVTSIDPKTESIFIEALRQVWTPTLKSAGFDAFHLKKLEDSLLGFSSVSSIAEEEQYWRRKGEEAKFLQDKTIFADAAKFLTKIRTELESALVSRVNHKKQNTSTPLLDLMIQNLARWEFEWYQKTHIAIIILFFFMLFLRELPMVENRVPNKYYDDMKNIFSVGCKIDGLISLEETVESISGYTDDLWKLSSLYSEDRMKSLLNIVGNQIAFIVQNMVGQEICSYNNRAKDEAIAVGASVCEKWTSMVEKLTTLFWPHHSLHPWTGPTFTPQACSKVSKRLRQTAELRAQYRQLTRLLTSHERSSLGIDYLIEGLDDVKAVFEESNGKPVEWNRLSQKVEEGLENVEERVAQKLKLQIADAKTPNSLFAEFHRYFDLIKREGLKRTLHGERETLLTAYEDLIENCLIGPDTTVLLDVPRILQEVQAAKSSEIRLEGLANLGNELLADLPGYEAVRLKLETAQKDVAKTRQYLTDQWVEETKESIARKDLTLSTNSAVVELTGINMMRVSYDSRLVTLIREARAFSSLGIALPREVRDLVERAGSLIARARALQQVATFHNTIGDRMVPCLRPLLLTTAIELAGAIQEQAGVVWADPYAVDSYIARLKGLVKKFAQQNSELTMKHDLLGDLVSSLLKGESINLIGNQHVWKDTLMNMRTIVDAVDAEYGNTDAWKLHWDRQLLKALWVAYRGSLPLLLKKVPEISVQLIFSDSTLQWRPSLEEVRSKLYSSIRRALSIPINFRGVGNTADAHFAQLIHKSAYLFGGVFKCAEILLSAMEAVRTKWLFLAAPLKINVSERLKGKSPEDWTRAFKDAKQWAQEVGKLRENEVKIWCISIDTATTRNDFEAASRRYWERLCSDLRIEASSRLVAITEFFTSASRELERRPGSVEEVSAAYEAHAQIEEKSSSIAQELEAINGFAKVLAAWTTEQLDGVGTAHNAWKGLADRLERHRAVVAHELENAKVNLHHKAIAVRDEIERWEVKWQAKPELVTLDWIASMREKWIQLQEQRRSLIADGQRVNLAFDDILQQDEETLRKLELQLEAEESNCKFQAEFMNELKEQEAEEWMVTRKRLPRLHEWLDYWENRTCLRSTEQRTDESLNLDDINLGIDTFVQRKVREVRSAIEWIQLLRGDEISEEHWAELRSLLDLNNITNNREITFGDLLSQAHKIQENAEKVKEITKRAAAESGIRQTLAEVESWESSTRLQLQESKDSKNAILLLVGEYSSLLARIGELKLLLEAVKSATEYDRFAAQASRCETTLSEVEERIKILSTVQRKWIYLEPVYAGGAAPSNPERWSRTDRDFRYLMREIVRDLRISSLRRIPLAVLTNLKDLLDKCQRSLDEYLEEKRSSYPRLYFLSDEDLLELVSNSGTGLDAHLPKLYQGVGSIIQEEDRLTAVISIEGEILKLPSPVDLKDSLPQWLLHFEEEIKYALRQSLEKCLTESTPDPSNYPTQVLLLSERIRFTERCEAALKEGRTALENLVEFLETQRARYRGLEDAADRLTALKARGLLLDTVHHLEVVRTLVNDVTHGKSATWTWHRQLRCYKSSKGPLIRCAEAEFLYRFEYQGAAVGLVQTPLTERCFLALTQAMKLGLGGSPTGPAGTGKTESVKALGSILGRLVLVFNCDEGMDADSMSRILGGLAQTGAWGCFDEFNRLDEETLSAVAMLIRPLQEAIRDTAREVLLGGKRVNLDPDCCIYITMNPVGSEYGGRNKLPDSLARLFRPIGMAHPDKTDIAKTLLECCGFLDATTLANQLVETLVISETLLSLQPHYDWGLRALRSILDALPMGNDLDETTRLVIAIKTSTLPKLTERDIPTFLSVLEDVFQKAHPSSTTLVENDDVLNVLIELCNCGGFTKDIVNRCIQLRDQLECRTGVAIVGPPGCGKTTIRMLLFEALVKIGKTIHQYFIYPGAIPKSKLLGCVDSRTREWKEGWLSNYVISAGESATWIVFNGDVNPEWAEALNSALDDNRLLTLPNGVRVKLGNGTRFIFETHDLANASPATVSRLGVVHLGSASPNILLSPLRLASLSEPMKQFTSAHLCACIEESLRIHPGTFSASGLMHAILSHLKYAKTQTSGSYALLMSLSGQIPEERSRDELARFIYQMTDCWCPNLQNPYDVLYDEEADRLYSIGEAESVTSEDGSICLLGVMKRALSTILPWIKNSQPLLIRGPDGCGKSTLISLLLSIIRNNESWTIINGSSLYGSQDLINRLKRACVKLDSSTHGRKYKPKNGGRIILILENIHIASIDLQEIMRQLLQEGGFHEEDLEFATVPLIAVCTADSETKLHPRLEALLAVHYLPYPNPKDMTTILELHLRQITKVSKILVESWTTRIALTIFDAFQSIHSSKTLLFPCNLKNLILWVDSMRYYPTSESEADLTHQLLDAGRRLFHPRMTLKDQNYWEATIMSKVAESKNFRNHIYVRKSGSVDLMPLDEDQWKTEVLKAAAKCVRDGESVQAPISSYLLATVAGINWALGTNTRGILLTGRPGAGRKSAAKLAANISSFRLIDSGPGRGRALIRSAVQTAGIDGEPTLLLLEEHHMREEGIDILAGAIVSKGELPGLFTMEELDGFIAPLTDLVRREDFCGSLDQYLYHRLRCYLHIAIILDIGDAKSPWLSRCELLKHCIIIGPSAGAEWWHREGSLIELTGQLLNLTTEKIEEPLQFVKVLVNSHLQAPHQQQAPARFFALVCTWRHLFESWNQEIEVKLASLQAGISRLKEAGEQVAKLEEEVSEQRQELEAEKRRANAALEQITSTMRGATGQRGEMASLKTETERESAELARRKADIEDELGKVEPLVEQAAQAVASISADALAEVRSLRAPPAPVRDVLEGVLRLMGIKDTSWNSMKTFLAKRGIKDEIRTWDARRSTASSLEAVAKLLKERPDSFEEKTAKRASIAAAPLAAWVLANLQYGQVLQQVAPLEREQRLLAERLSAAEAQLGKLAAGLNSVEGRVAQLQEELSEHSRGAAALQLRAEATEAKLTTARTLLRKLDAEHRDWQTQFEELTLRKQRLDVEAADVGSLLVYQDPKLEVKRKKTAIDLLINEREKLQWRAQGLPADTESLVGASCILRGPLVPILVDPSGVAVSWLKNNIGPKLEITKPEDSKFLTTLELAVRFGKALLIEEIIELPPVLLTLLRHRPLKVNERTTQIKQGFKLFLATRREQLEGIPKEADAVLFKVELADNTKSLTERFIERVILKETPELAFQRKEALEREEELFGERDAARLDLLGRLGITRGQDLLQESDAQQGGVLSMLEVTQSKAKEIARALEESRTVLNNVSRRASNHEKLAQLAAHLYKAVKAFSALSPLYVFSVESFMDIYLEAGGYGNASLPGDKKEQDKLAEKRLISLTFLHCSKAVYRKHRLPLALHLALSLNPVPDAEKDFLLNISTLNNDEDSAVFEIPEWIPEERIDAVRLLARSLPQIAAKMKSAWLKEVNSIYGENGLTAFQKVLITKALRPEYLFTAISKFAAEKLGVKDLVPPPCSVKEIVEMETLNPVLLILSPGADPEPELCTLASSHDVEFAEVSLGQGQIAQAEIALENACRNGSWLLLSNLQLALKWLPRLESLLRSAVPKKSPTARIWLTTEECTGFYPNLAGLCLKVAYEPPEGIKRNVKRSLQQLQQLQQPETDVYKSFLLSWLHAVLQERRKFTPQGWVKAYEWNESDLYAAYKLIVKQTPLKKKQDSKGLWEIGRGLLDVAVYGGRPQDDYDMRALRSIIADIWSVQVLEGRKKLGNVLRVYENTLEDLVKLLDRLDDTDSPKEYYGLPGNAHRAWERTAAEIALSHLKGISSKTLGDKEKYNKMESRINKNLKDLITRHNSIFVTLTSFENEDVGDPLQRFAANEMNLLKKLLNIVRTDIEANNVNSSKIPKHWNVCWPLGPTEVTPFINVLLSKYQAIESLNGLTNLAYKIDLSRLVRPRAFLAALKQHTSKRTKHPFENLQLSTEWCTMDRLDEKKEISVLIEGLLISGALIEDGRLKDLEADAAPVVAAPICQIAFVPKEDTRQSSGRKLLNYDEQRELDIPVYANSQREVLICSFPVKCLREEQDTWKRRGVMLYLKSI